jgi:hypothetical protein
VAVNIFRSKTASPSRTASERHGLQETSRSCQGSVRGLSSTLAILAARAQEEPAKRRRIIVPPGTRALISRRPESRCEICDGFHLLLFFTLEDVEDFVLTVIASEATLHDRWKSEENPGPCCGVLDHCQDVGLAIKTFSECRDSSMYIRGTVAVDTSKGIHP